MLQVLPLILGVAWQCCEIAFLPLPQPQGSSHWHEAKKVGMSIHFILKIAFFISSVFDVVTSLKIARKTKDKKLVKSWEIHEFLLIWQLFFQNLNYLFIIIIVFFVIINTSVINFVITDIGLNISTTSVIPIIVSTTIFVVFPFTLKTKKMIRGQP